MVNNQSVRGSLCLASSVATLGLYESDVANNPASVTGAFRGLAAWAEAVAKLPANEAGSCGGNESAGPDLASLEQVANFIEWCLAGCEAAKEASKGNSGGEVDVALCKLLFAVCGMLGRLQTTHTSHVMMAWTNGHFKDNKNLKPFLPKQLHSLAHALAVDWKQEISAIEDSQEFSQFVAKLGVAEASYSAIDSAQIEGDVFQTVKADLSKYTQAFSSGMTKLLRDMSQSTLGPLEKFNSKYEGAERAVTDWTVKDIDWIFAPENAPDVENDQTQAKTARMAAADFVKELEGAGKHVTEVPALKEIIAQAEKERTGILEAEQKTVKLQLYILYTSLVMDPTAAKRDVEDADKVSKKLFGLGRDSLPEKLAANVKDVEKRVLPKESKEKKKDKEKNEKKDKKDKGEGQGDKTKKSKNDMSPEFES